MISRILIIFLLAIVVVVGTITAYAYAETPSKATTYVHVYSNDSWTGSILDSGFDSESHQGYFSERIPFTCEDGGVYSVFFQKGELKGTVGLTNTNLMIVKIIVDGKIVDEGATTAEYGVVTLAGNC